MTVACWGTYGKPVVLFPTASADCFDYERFKLIWKLQPLIDAGRIKVYSCESINGLSWLNPDASPQNKAIQQKQYDQYVSEELLPFIEEDCNGYRGFITAGASLGAYNALHAGIRNPEYINTVIAMSGTYDFDRWMESHRDQNYYHTQPMYYLGNISNQSQTIQQLKQSTFVIASGSGQHEAPDESRRIAWLLQMKGLKTYLEIWGEDAHHDWPTWRSMLPLFLEKLL